METLPRPYPAIEPHRSGMLAVDPLHTLYWEESGNPNGVPVVLLHGGPGSGTAPRHRQFFDPACYRIVLFDQRGAGRSTPPAECRDNTTALLVADMEQLRAMLGIDQWLTLEWVAWAHTAGAFMMLAFFFIHVYLTTTGHTVTAHIKAMVTGWEEEHDEGHGAA